MIVLCKFEHTCFEGTRAPLLYTADEIIISNINLILFSSLYDYCKFRIYCRNSSHFISFPLVDKCLLWSSISSDSICEDPGPVLILRIQDPCLFSRIQYLCLFLRLQDPYLFSRIRDLCSFARIQDLCLFSRIQGLCLFSSFQDQCLYSVIYNQCLYSRIHTPRLIERIWKWVIFLGPDLVNSWLH